MYFERFFSQIAKEQNKTYIVVGLFCTFARFEKRRQNTYEAFAKLAFAGKI
jgi:hypothetical protein